MLTDHQKKLIVSSWRLVVPIAETAADLFYRRLFELKPEYQHHFSNDLDKQKRKLVAMLSFIVKSLDWTGDQWRDEVNPEDDLFLVVLALGRRHGELYQIPDSSYPVVGEALIWTLDYGLGEAFTDEIKEAWLEVYTQLSRMMLLGTKSSINAQLKELRS